MSCILSAFTVTSPDDTVKSVPSNVATPAFVSVASSAVTVRVPELSATSIPSPPAKVAVLPNEIAVVFEPSEIVQLEFASLLFAIEPASLSFDIEPFNIAFVTPLAGIVNVKSNSSPSAPLSVSVKSMSIPPPSTNLSCLFSVIVTSVPSPSSTLKPSPISTVLVVVIEPPNAVALPSIVIDEFASLAFAIEPASMALVTPLAFTLTASEFNSIEASSTPTARTPLENDKPSPATDEDNAISSAFAVIPSPPATLSVTSPDVPPPVKPVPATTLDISPVSDILNCPELAVRPVPAIPDTKSATLSFLVELSDASINGILSASTATVAPVNSFKSSASDNAPLVPPPERPSPAVTPVISAVVERTPFVAVIFVPAIAVARSAIVSFLLELSPASIIAILSFATSTAAAVNSFRSNASDTPPLVPPPDKPSPAVTPVTSPCCPLIVNVPAASSYDNDTPVPAVKRALTLSSIASFAAVPNAAAVKSPELSIASVVPIVNPFLIMKFFAVIRWFLRQ